MHFLDVFSSSEIRKKNILAALLFVGSCIVGIGGGIQYFILNTLNFQVSFDLRNSSVVEMICQLSFHLIPFVLGILGVVYVTKNILYQPFKKTLGETDKIGQRLFVSFVLYLLLASSFLAIRQIYGGHLIKKQLDFDFSIIVLILVVFVFAQVFFEELIFRAFLPQVFVGLGLSKTVAIIVSSIVFGLLHNSNPEVTHYGKWILILYIINGLFLGFITYLDKSIWLAVGYHFANNFLSLVFISSEEQVLKVPSLFVAGQENNNLSLMIFQLFVTIVIFFAAGFKLYRWKINRIG